LWGTLAAAFPGITGTDFEWFRHSTRNGTASVPYESPIFSQLHGAQGVVLLGWH
jgi:hypothetical protein